MVLKGPIQVVLDSQFDTAMIYQPAIVIAFKICPESSQESFFRVALFV